VSGSVISWAICKSAPRSRQTRQHPTTQFFTGRMPFLPPNQHRQSTGKSLTTPPHLKYAATLPCNLSLSACSADNVSQGSVATMHVLSTKLIYVCALLRLGMWMRPILQSDEVAWPICQCQLVMTVSSEPIKVPFGEWTDGVTGPKQPCFTSKSLNAKGHICQRRNGSMYSKWLTRGQHAAIWPAHHRYDRNLKYFISRWSSSQQFTTMC